MRWATATRKRMARGFLTRIAISAAPLMLPGAAFAAEGDPALGQAVYKKECVVCHGTQGYGDGPASGPLVPKPRDFTKGVFKIRSTPGLPTDDDLFRTISGGVPGTLMPSYKHLSEQERWGLVAYVKSFSEKFKDAEALTPISVPDPPPETPEMISAGKQYYEDFSCGSCHGPIGKGDGPAARMLKDEWGYPITPYDFTVPGRMKGGSTVKDIYRTLAVGTGGTPMPSYLEALSEEQTWALAYYVRSLASEDTMDWESDSGSGDEVAGKNLFMGATRFQNGGAPCMACHSVTALGTGGVGSFFGPDLTPAHSKFGSDGITTVLTDLPFPTMNAVFSKYPLTQEEQNDLISFFQASTPDQQPAEVVRVRGRSPVYFAPTVGVAGVAVIFLTVVGLRAGQKKTEART